MVSVERITTPEVPVDDLAEVRDFIRVSGDYEDSQISEMIAAAAYELEQAAGLALLEQEIRVTLEGWPDLGRLALPIAPALRDETLTATADDEPIAAALITGLRPSVKLTRPAGLAAVPRVVITYTAGFGATAEAIPPDLRHAIRDQVALAFDGRGQSAHEARRDLRGLSATSYAFQRAVGRYRRVAL